MTMDMDDMRSNTASILRWRRRLVEGLDGDVLEIGVGTGENLSFYRRARRVWAIEPDLTRAKKAQSTAQRGHVPIRVDVAPVETLPYRGDSFDHVVSSLVFCSVSDQRQALAEIRRVLRPDGLLHMVEHICPQQPQLATLCAGVTPYWRKIAHNCHLNRHTLDVLGEEGWAVDVHQRLLVFVYVTAQAQSGP